MYHWAGGFLFWDLNENIWEYVKFKQSRLVNEIPQLGLLTYFLLELLWNPSVCAWLFKKKILWSVLSAQRINISRSADNFLIEYFSQVSKGLKSQALGWSLAIWWGYPFLLRILYGWTFRWPKRLSSCHHSELNPAIQNAKRFLLWTLVLSEAFFPFLVLNRNLHLRCRQNKSYSTFFSHPLTNQIKFSAL